MTSGRADSPLQDSFLFIRQQTPVPETADKLVQLAIRAIFKTKPAKAVMALDIRQIFPRDIVRIVLINAMYSDCCKVAKKSGVNTADF